MKYSPLIIGLVAPSGGGKTSTCDYIQSLGFLKIHAATPLKRAFCSMFKVPAEYTERPLIEEPADFLGGALPRDVLEHLGDKLHQIAPAAIPITITTRLKSMKRLGKPWVLVDGVRRATEGVAIREQGGHIIRITGKDIDPGKPCDISQLAVEADFEIQYSPTLEGLRSQLDEVLVQIMPPGALEDAKRR